MLCLYQDCHFSGVVPPVSCPLTIWASNSIITNTRISRLLFLPHRSLQTLCTVISNLAILSVYISSIFSLSPTGLSLKKGFPFLNADYVIRSTTIVSSLKVLAFSIFLCDACQQTYILALAQWSTCSVHISNLLDSKITTLPKPRSFIYSLSP